MKTITFLFPAPAKRPAGGYKMVFEYANRLVNDGHLVNIVYAGSIFWKKKKLLYKLSGIYRYFEKVLKGFSARRWFPLDPRIKEYLSFSLNERHMPKSDIYVCSTPITAQYLNNYNIPPYSKFYFIQGYENWGGITENELFETYHFNMSKIVVSNWLQKILKSQNEESSLVPNGFDTTLFKKNIEIDKRSKFAIGIVYNKVPIKGFKFGYEALLKIKEKYPNIKVYVFGTFPRPDFLDSDFQYFFSPSKERIINIYNDISIFVAPGIQEGFGLTVGEAMACGVAVVCTDNEGYKEMAVNEKNCLMSPVKNPDAMAENIIRLIEDNELRIRLAEQGYKDIQAFDIEISYLKFKTALGLD